MKKQELTLIIVLAKHDIFMSFLIYAVLLILLINAGHAFSVQRESFDNFALILLHGF